MFQPSSLAEMAPPEPEPPSEDHGRGFAPQISAQALWDASLASQEPGVRRRARWRFFLYGERPEPIPAHRGPVNEPGATGICCSGGGIRSAAFNLGALQALQRDGLLHDADYLAAVSGGSYIAAAFCMVGKTSPGGANDDSDAELIAQTPPFSPGSPEEQYLRNRSSYMAPDARAKTYLGLRLLLGLMYNLAFLALPVIGLAILAGLAYLQIRGQFAPADRDLIAWLVPACVAGAGALISGFRLLRRPPTAAARGFSETWSVRLVFAGALIAVLTLALPALVDVVQSGARHSGDAHSASIGQATGGAGFVGLIAGLLASLRQIFASPQKLTSSLSKTKGRFMKLNKRTRKLLVALAALVAGPLLFLTIAVEALAITARDYHSNAEWLVVAGAGALVLFAFLYAVSDLTTWSLHPFYKRRLSSAFALKRVRPDACPRASTRTVIAQENDEGIAVERDFDKLLPLSETACAGGPTLVVCAAANISDCGATPPGRPVTSFTFSAETIGGPLVGGLNTKDFEDAFRSTRRKGDLTLPAAVAMSGAALSPSMGKAGNRSFRFLMTLANIRLGVWVPNPRWVAGSDVNQRRRYKRPRPGYLVRELLGHNRIDAKYLYVTDGGHYENLGLVELLRRGCTSVYCFDASGGQTFAELGDAVALARSELGVQIEIDPTPLMPVGDPPTAAAAAVTGTITYPDGATGTIVYARNVVAPGAPWDVLAHQRKDADFPHDTTLDQLYTDQKFESYRALGEHAATYALALMDPEPGVCDPRADPAPAPVAAAAASPA